MKLFRLKYFSILLSLLLILFGITKYRKCMADNPVQMQVVINEKRNILVPFELNGKVGFVNQDLKKIADAKYTVFDIQKYCAVIREGNDIDYEDYVLRFDGKLVRIPSDKKIGLHCVAWLIGDEYYCIQYPYRGAERFHLDPETYVVSTVYSVFTEEKYKYKDIVVTKSNSIDYLCVNYNDNGPRYNYMARDGTMRFLNNTFKWLHGFDEERKVGVVQDENFNYRIIDENGNYITPDTAYFTFFSDGLVRGRMDGKLGYYDTHAKLVIPIVETEDSFAVSFKSGVLPCIINDDKIYTERYARSNDWGIISKNGEVVAEGLTADRIREFSYDGVAVLELYETDVWHFYLINTKGVFLTEEPYDAIQDSVNGYCRAVKDGIDYLISSIDGSAYICKDF